MENQILYNKTILKHFNYWYQNTNNDLLLLDSLSNNYFKKIKLLKNNNNYYNFIKKKKIQYYKPKNFSMTFFKKNDVEKKNYDYFFSLEGLLKFKEKFSNNKNKFFLTYEFGEKLKITFNDSELFRHKKKFNDFKINDTLTFIFFLKKNFFQYNNFYNNLIDYKFTSWRQFFIIPLNLYYQNHLYNITKNDHRFDELRKNTLINYFKSNNNFKKSINLTFVNNILNFNIKKKYLYLLHMMKNNIYNIFYIIIYIYILYNIYNYKFISLNILKKKINNFYINAF